MSTTGTQRGRNASTVDLAHAQTPACVKTPTCMRATCGGKNVMPPLTLGYMQQKHVPLFYEELMMRVNRYQLQPICRPDPLHKAESCALCFSDTGIHLVIGN